MLHSLLIRITLIVFVKVVAYMQRNSLIHFSLIFPPVCVTVGVSLEVVLKKYCVMNWNIQHRVSLEDIFMNF